MMKVIMMLMMKVLVNIDPAKQLYKKRIKEREGKKSLKCYENHSIIIYTRRKMIVLNSKLLND